MRVLAVVLVVGCRDAAPPPPPLPPPTPVIDAPPIDAAPRIDWRIGNVSAEGKRVLLVAGDRARTFIIATKRLESEGETKREARMFPLGTARYGARISATEALADSLRVADVAGVDGFAGTWAYSTKTSILRIVVGPPACVLDISFDKRSVTARACIDDVSPEAVKLSPSGEWAAWASNKRVRAMHVATKRVSIDLEADGDVQVSDHGYVTISGDDFAAVWYPDDKDLKRMPQIEAACRFVRGEKSKMVCPHGDTIRVLSL